jgi:hypothetical protein
MYTIPTCLRKAFGRGGRRKVMATGEHYCEGREEQGMQSLAGRVWKPVAQMIFPARVNWLDHANLHSVGRREAEESATGKFWLDHWLRANGNHPS